MGKTSRQQEILKFLKKENFMKVTDLAKYFKTTEVTIRRDLDELEKRNLISRIHGGAILVKTEHSLPSFTDRIQRENIEKNMIAKKAASMIEPDSIICMDGSTSALAIAQYIPHDFHFTLITTGIATALEYCKFPNIDIIQVGGIVHHSSYTSRSVLAQDFISQFNADIVFFSTRAVSPIHGTYESSMDLVEEKRSVVSISNKVVLLADHSKFETMSLCLAVKMSEIDIIMTDSMIDNEIAEQIENNKVQLQICT